MPKRNGVGLSRYTKIKQEQFLEIMQLHVAIVRQIWRKKHRWLDNSRYFYADLTAGPGIYNIGKELVDGSPIVFLKEFDDLPIKARFCEEEALNAEILLGQIHRIEHAVSKLGRDEVSVYGGSYQDFILDTVALQFCYREISKPLLGMVYIDPSGDLPDFEYLGELFEFDDFRSIDLLLHLSATNIKRMRNSASCEFGMSLRDCLSMIGKKHWLVREPHKAHQWTFIVGSNWVKFPDFRRIGLHSVKSERGIEILEYLDKTAKEREDCDADQNLVV